MVARVDQIWRYPAKSMLGEQLDEAVLATNGLVGDRGWAVRDEMRGGIRGAKKIPGLMHLAASYLREPSDADPTPEVEFTLPDGRRVTSADPDIDRVLSSAIDHPVRLFPLQPADDLDHYRRGPADSDDLVVELRAIFDRLEDEPLPDFSVFPPEILEFESPPGTYVDAFPLLLVSQTSLRSLQALVPESAVDLRRFRPNLVIADDVEPNATPTAWPELDWVGRRASIGDALIEIVAPCPRCVMITRAVAELPADRSIMRAVVREAGQHLGVYATVVEGGLIASGSPLRFE